MNFQFSISNLQLAMALGALLFVSCAAPTGGTRSASPQMMIAAADAQLFIPPSPETLTLSWEYPVIFRVYSSHDVSAPLATWPLVTNIFVTNFSFTIPATGAQEFFTMRAAFLHDGLESDFSNIATNPILISK